MALTQVTHGHAEATRNVRILFAVPKRRNFPTEATLAGVVFRQAGLTTDQLNYLFGCFDASSCIVRADKRGNVRFVITGEVWSGRELLRAAQALRGTFKLMLGVVPDITEFFDISQVDKALLGRELVREA